MIESIIEGAWLLAGMAPVANKLSGFGPEKLGIELFIEDIGRRPEIFIEFNRPVSGTI